MLIAAGTLGWAKDVMSAERLPTSASIVMYHRFGDSRYPATNTTLEQLEEHIAELKRGSYTVLSVPEIVQRQSAGEPLPDRTVGITIDDAFISVYEEGWPKLRDAELPVTLFVATAAVDRGSPDYMTWDQVRELRDAGVEIGSQTHNHPHMPRLSRAQLDAELSASNARFEEELGTKPTLFAFPYGEASLEAVDAVKAAGFAAAFGQHSGAFSAADNRYYLPRFAMNEAFGDLARFRRSALAMAMAVDDFSPPGMIVSSQNPPNVGFTVGHPQQGLRSLACYASHEGQAELQILGDIRVEVRFKAPFPKGRTRLNCTMPAGDGRWFWFGRQFYKAN